MKILHVITGMRKAAGTTTFVENVVDGLRAAGHEVEIVMGPDGFCQCDIMHIHGLWSMLLHETSKYAKAHNIPVVWSTHGMTAPWSMRHKWWKKFLAWCLYQKWDLKQARIIHCTTALEMEWNRKLGFKHCMVVPLGTNAKPGHSMAKEHKTLLFVGRIYPVKAIDCLIKAFGRVDPEIRRDWRLRIVGPDQAGHQAAMEKLVWELKLNESVEFAGPKFGVELDEEYDQCDCLALVSHTENFGATIVDAMAHGKPVIAGDKTPWREVAERKCGWWVSNEAAQLSATIAEMMVLSDSERGKMGDRGRKLVEEKYTWGAVAEKMVNVYEDILK